MELSEYAICLIHTFLVVSRVPLTKTTTTFSPPTEITIVKSTVTTAGTTETDDEIRMPAVSSTEQVMDHNIRVSDLPVVDEPTDTPDLDWDKNRLIRDVAYFIRAHKFHDYDRRYYKNVEKATSRLYEEFPRPGLRSLHWEVRKYCDASFVECLKYLERIIKLTALRREDDTVTVMREQKWSLTNNTEQILAVQRDCQMAQRRDNLTMVPFQGPIERFQWRTTVSYYMCWYTMQGVADLAVFGEPCDNHANCLDEYGVHNKDPRADDTKPYACALYSFCPDHCCPMKHIRYMKDCFQSERNPCYAENRPAHRKCRLNREENRDFQALRSNRINVSCECHRPGHEWSSRFGMCIDVNECARGTHNCTLNAGESCFNLPGRYACICRLGYVYSPEMKRCVYNLDFDRTLKGDEEEPKAAETKGLLDAVIRTITRSTGNKPANTGHIYIPLILIALMYDET
ncbi:PREDICTED: uncharacterized protein LOC106747286 [Dinoponera quadriceps]|uniref:Uncharacterized protein LOC106747286 n=1 Tax=Dinoponera quadriceps TaxID=609295 RepID=A0A6P3XQG0_DINQU|nr:PREDICTED: uncharacterized protein LOC106747286 [Dinoponera quadriceps]